METLAGKVAFITGGAQRLGEAICRALAKSGAQVICADIKEDRGAKSVREMNDAGQKAIFFNLDITNELAVKGAIESAGSMFGGIDILVNNAGIDVTLPTEEITTSQWDNIISVNLRGPFLVSKYALSGMKGRRSGHIFNITSTAKKRAWLNASAYHASKWGLLGFSHALHVEARKYNVKVTAIISEGMLTPFLPKRSSDMDINSLQEPDNVAQTIKFILSQPRETVIPEVMVLPMHETSWP